MTFTIDQIEKEVENKLVGGIQAVTFPVAPFRRVDFSFLQSTLYNKGYVAKLEDWLNGHEGQKFVNISVERLEDGEVIYTSNVPHKALVHTVTYTKEGFRIRRQDNHPNSPQNGLDIEFAVVSDYDVACSIADYFGDTGNWPLMLKVKGF